jgi:hypothetical protein
MWTVSQVASHSANGSGGQSIELKLDLIDVAPSPVFTWFNRFHDGMFGRMKMFGGVFVFGRVAAPDMAATQAEAQVNPGVVHLQAFLTAMGMRFHVPDLVKVGAGHAFRFA